MTNVLNVDGVSRSFGDRQVLKDVSFAVHAGRMTGFVGANGAGKTTTMRIVVGVLAATSGSVTWQGREVDASRRHDLGRSMGYMPEERGLYPKMSPLDQLVFFGRLHRMTTSDAADRSRTLLEQLGLGDRLDEPLEKLSLGNQQRVQIAAALVHRPTALVLDEPFSGLDPVAVDSMVALLREELSDEVPVLFSSHQLELVERLCDDLVILSEGSLVAAGTVEDLRGRQDSRFRVRLAGDADAGLLRDVPGLDVLDATGSCALLRVDQRPEDALAAVAARVPVAEFARVVRPLSEIYREVVA
jgi:ABC-2 type transport system ATP-binding protein